jgi:hypothetical protein
MKKRMDLTGEKYGRLTVIKEVATTKAYRQWLCKCDCGNETIVRMNQLRTGKTKSCGCLHKERISEANSKDLRGKKYGYLTVIKRSEIGSVSKGVMWECECKCGNITKVATEHLISGAIVSCGCRRKEAGEEVKKYIEENYRVDGVMTTSLMRKRQKNNTTGVKGVSEYKTKSCIKYRVFIGIKNKNLYLGTYNTLEEAATARKNAEEKYHKPYLGDDKNE